MVIIVPDITDEEIAEQLGRISTYITDVEGEVKEVLTDSPWGRRRLAYTIRFNSVDYRDGYYAVYHFDARPTQLTDLERELKLDTKVIRYLLVHDDPKAGVKTQETPATDETEAPAEETPATETPAQAAPAAEAVVETTEAPAEVAAETTETPAETAVEETPAAEVEAAPATSEGDSEES